MPLTKKFQPIQSSPKKHAVIFVGYEFNKSVFKSVE